MRGFCFKIMGFLQAYAALWKNAFNFRGRATCGEYWYPQIVLAVPAFYVFLLGDVPVSQLSHLMLAFLWASAAYFLIALIPSISLTIRRLHDTGRSGLYVLLPLIPYIGSLILLYFLCGSSDLDDNKYGSCPIESDEYEEAV